jgi:PAS domain S-box-containing protein
MGIEKSDFAQNLSFFLESAAQFVDLSFQDDLYEFVAKKIQQLHKNSIVSVSTFDPKSCSLKVHAVHGLGKLAESVAKLMGSLPTLKSFRIENHAKQELLKGKLVEIPEGIAGLSPDLPKPVWKSIERLLNIGKAYSMGLVWKGDLFGNIVILLPKNEILSSPDLIEAFVNLSSVALQNKRTQEALDKIYREIEIRVTERTKNLDSEIENHKKTLEILSQKEEDYRLLTEVAGEIIMTLNFDGTIMYINQKGLEISGYSLEEAIGADFSQIILKDKVEHIKTILEKRAQGFNEHLLYETEFINKNGMQVPIEISSNLIIKRGKPFGVLVSARDITERKNTENALRRSEHKHRTLINTMQEGLVEVDADWNIVFVNDRFLQILGVAKERLLGMSFHDLVSKDYLSNSQKQHALQRDGKTESFELELVRSDGKIIFVFCSPNLLYDLRGNHIGGFAVISDITEHKLSAEKLKQSEERYKFLAENMGDIVWTLDMEFNTTYISPSVEKVLGFTPEERKKQTLEEMVTPESMERISKRYLEELERDSLKDKDMNRDITIEVEYYHRNGSIIWMENNIKAIRDEAGKIVGMYGVSRDVTLRKQAEEETTRAKEEWETTFNTMPDLVAILDKHFHIVRANKAMADRLGISQKEIIGKTCYEFMHGTTEPPPDCPHQKLLADAKRHDTDLFEDRLNGHFFVTATPLFDLKGELVGSIHIARDITELKRAEKGLKESETRFRTIFDQAAVGVALTSTQTGTLLRANKKYCDIVGYSEEDLKNMTFQILTHPEDLQKDLDYMELIKEKKIDEFSLEKRYLKPDGSTVWVNLAVSSMGEDCGRSAQHIAVIEDITERKMLERMLGIQRDLAVKLGVVRNLDEALTICIDSVLKIEAIDCGGIYLVNTLDGSIDLVIHRDLPADFVQIASHFDIHSPQARVISKGKTIHGSYADILEGMGMSSDEINIRLESGLHYLIAIPILHEGSPVGSLNLGAKKSKTIPDYIRVSLETIAAQIAGVISKITIDQSLENSRKNLKALFETMDDFVFILDGSGNISDFNPVVEGRLGYSAQELSQMNVLDVHPIERRQEAAEIVSKMLEGKLSACPIPLQCKDGTMIPVETKISLGKWDNKDAIFGISRDISDRLRIEEEKKVSEERLLAAIEAIDEGFVIYDADDRFVMSNAKYLEIYKESKDVLIPGETFENILRYGLKRGQYPQAKGREEEWLSERMTAHRSSRLSIEQNLPDNRWLKISERKTKEGSTVGFRVDITDIKQTEEKLQKAVKEKEALLKEIHHRVKNNMQVISSLLSLQTTKYNDPKLIEAFRETEARVNSMAFVHEILYQSENLSRINLRDYLEKLAGNLSASFIAGNSPSVIMTDVEEISIELKTAVPCGLIVTELVTNALKYASPPESGLIIQIAAAYQQNGNIQMIVSDNGQKLTHKIDPKKTTTLGIQLVAEIITEQLDGSFSIEQEKGVRWVIEWPG